MLMLTRKLGESIVIDGNITITLMEAADGKARLGFDAPRSVTIYRTEVMDRIRATAGGDSGTDGNVNE